MLRQPFRGGRDLLVRMLQSLPISSRVLGPPKGYYRSFDEYTQAVDDQFAKMWPLLAPESLILRMPTSVRAEQMEIFQPLVHESPGFG